MALRHIHGCSKLRRVSFGFRRKRPLRFRGFRGGVKYYVLPDACADAQESGEAPEPAESATPMTPPGDRERIESESER